ncbi:response regulator transcription factor [Neorhizobium alkalisoli]|uniref:LuxR family two component transcriptional regulator n=1 Tax=Neorhizobium alkalisoli TaxID=528178 RepID=A0A561R8C2_9HYPH|nr:response regulator transcription factor [Neorhizobium alkalisoli]TWF58858.1 LuxR family two component transcriptional regulator [Neorhizobium alkalisoli]
MIASRKPPAGPTGPVVYIVDDDISMRESLVDLFRSMSIDAVAFENTETFLAAARPGAGCILLDVRLPDLNGLELQAHLNAKGNKMPIIFMTGYGDIPMSVKAIKAGASDFLTKPFDDQALLDAVNVALERDAEIRKGDTAIEASKILYETLTPREQEVMQLVVRGLMNKQIAFELGITEVTVKLHRGNVMRKMDVRSLADLVRVGEALGYGKQA